MTSFGPEPPAQHADGTPAQPSAGEQPQQPADWAWAQPRPTAVIETEPLEYHRLLRGVQNYRWWKPLLLLIVAGVYFGIMTVVLSIGLVPFMMMLDPDYATDLVAGTGEIIDTQRPVSLLVALTSIIIMIPAVILAMLTLGMRPAGRAWSVAARIRWGLLMRLLGVAALSVVVMNVVGIVLGLAVVAITDPAALTEPPPVSGPEFDVTAALISLVLIVLLVPFQAVAEELVFRGLFMQVIGAWLKNPWFAILIPSAAFAAAHIYDPWGLAAVGLLGGVAAWLTWKTGGLEAAMAIHIANNMIVFMLMTSGFGGETAQTTEGGGPVGVIAQAIGLALFLWLSLLVFRRGRYGRTRIDLIVAPVTDSAPPAPAAPVTAPAQAEERRFD